MYGRRSSYPYDICAHVPYFRITDWTRYHRTHLSDLYTKLRIISRGVPGFTTGIHSDVVGRRLSNLSWWSSFSFKGHLEWKLVYSERICYWFLPSLISSCSQAGLWMAQSVLPSVRPSVRPSVCPSVTPFSLCSHHRIIMKFPVFTNGRSDIHDKGHRQRSKVNVTEVKLNLAVSGL